MRALMRLLCCAVLALGWSAAKAQNTDTYFYTPGGGGVNGAVGMCLNAANKAVPCNAANVQPSPVTLSGGDPCLGNAKLGAPINLVASGQVIAGASNKKTYICAFNLVSATAQNIALVEGTGATCATNIFGLAGGTTAATGWNFSANSGLANGSGEGTVISPSADANATAANVCLLLSGTGQVSGQISYVQQ